MNPGLNSNRGHPADVDILTGHDLIDDHEGIPRRRTVATLQRRENACGRGHGVIHAAGNPHRIARSIRVTDLGACTCRATSTRPAAKNTLQRRRFGTGKLLTEGFDFLDCGGEVRLPFIGGNQGHRQAGVTEHVAVIVHKIATLTPVSIQRRADEAERAAFFPSFARRRISARPSAVSSFGSGFGVVSGALLRDTSASPLALVLMKSTREQGGSGQVFDPVEVIDDDSFGGVHLFTFGFKYGRFSVLLFSHKAIDLTGKEGEFTTPLVFRRHPSITANGFIQVGPTVQ